MTMAEWQAVCTRLGLMDPDEKPDSARALMSRCRAELVAADWVVCNGKFASKGPVSPPVSL